MERSGFGTSPSTSGTSTPRDTTLSKAASDAHAAGNAIADAAEGAMRKAKPAIDKVANMAHQAVDKAAASAAPAAEWIEEKSQQLDQTQRKLVNDTCAYISANPLTSVGLAALAGFLLSRLTRAS